MRVHLGQIEQAKEAANKAASNIVNREIHVVNMGLMCTLSPQLLASAIASFSGITSNTELLIHDVWEAKALDLLISGALDCVIMAHANELPDRFEEKRLTSERMLVAMNKSHPYSDRESVKLTELENLQYVDRLRCEFRETFFEELRSQELSVNVVMRTEREDLVWESVTEAIGISIMPESAANHAGLETASIEGLSIIRNISIVNVKDRELNPAVLDFIEHITETYKNS